MSDVFFLIFDEKIIYFCHKSKNFSLLDIPKEKISDETPFELQVEAKAQWTLLRNDALPDVAPPLTSNNPLLNEYEKLNRCPPMDDSDENKGDKWLSQVEIITHSGPHRRLWMGPQFQFKVIFLHYFHTKISLINIFCVRRIQSRAEDHYRVWMNNQLKLVRCQFPRQRPIDPLICQFQGSR